MHVMLKVKINKAWIIAKKIKFKFFGLTAPLPVAWAAALIISLSHKGQNLPFLGVLSVLTKEF